MASNKETFAIKLSIFGSAFVAVLGIGISLWGNSMSLLFDALHTFIAMLISVAGLRIANLLKIERSEKFNFGYYLLEPFFVFINGVLLLGLVGALLYSSIESLLNGGRLIEIEVVTGYLLFCTIYCTALWLILKSCYHQTKSEIVLAESVNWMLDALICIVVFIAFCISFLIKGTKYEFIIPYIDPTITLILVFTLINQPLKLTMSGLKDMLKMAPSKTFLEEIKSKLDHDKLILGINEYELKVAKMGRFYQIELTCIFDKNEELKNFEALNALNIRIKSHVQGYYEHLKVTVLFDIK